MEEIKNAIDSYQKMLFESFQITQEAFISNYDKLKTSAGQGDNTKTTWENFRAEKLIHTTLVIDGNKSYEINYYIEENNLFGEICYYVPSNYTPDKEDNDSDTPVKKGVG